MKIMTFILLTVSCSLFSACGIMSLSDELNDLNYFDPDNMIAIIACTEDNYSDEQKQILFVDINNKKRHKLVSIESRYFCSLDFSNNNNQLVFSSKQSTGYGIIPEISIYDILHDTTYNINRTGYLFGYRSFWNHDDSGIYYMDDHKIKYFDVNYQTDITIYDESEVYLDAMINRNTLLVYIIHSHEPNLQPGNYLLSTSGKIISRVNNPYLDSSPKRYIRALYYLHWSPENKLILGSSFWDYDKTNIALTNLDGSYFKVFDSNYDDRAAQWGPKGKSIIFERRDENAHGTDEYKKIMILDLETKEIKELISPKDIEHVTSLELLMF